MKEFLCKLILSCTLAGPGAKPVDELTYGTVLFDYFQEEHSAALVTAMVADVQGLRGEDTVRFDLAEGSFAFSAGLFDTAAAAFAEIDSAELTDIDQQRLAFHLAREYHRRGAWGDLQDQLGRIDLGANWRGKVRSHPEVEYMRADLALEQQDFDTARSALALIPEDSAFRAYGLFNLGVSLKTSDTDAASAAFSELAELRAVDSQTFDLIQRSKLALAFLANEQESQADAARVLEQLPASGRYRDTALAAYGSLAMGQGEYELAARIWMTLRDEPYWTPSTAAARLGFPISLEHLASQDGSGSASQAMALQQYRRAESTFEARLTALDSLSEQARDPDWIRELLATFSTPDVAADTQADLMERWQEQLGHTDWLEWLASETVHGLLSDWRSLLSDQQWLEQVPAELGALEQVAQEQRRRGAAAKSALYEDRLVDQRQQLSGRLGGLNSAITTLTSVEPQMDWQWMQEIGTADERKTLARLQSMQALVSERYTGADRQKWLDRITRLRGTILWQQTTEHATRLQALRQTAAQAAEMLASVDQSLERVQNAESQFVAGVETDFVLLADRVDTVRDAVAAAVADREERLAQEIRRGMRNEMQQVQQYLLVTRVAIARTADQLALADLPGEAQ
ncbi:MAG: hypothetical protein AB8B93_10395 [Pseudomonadales bacterium]